MIRECGCWENTIFRNEGLDFLSDREMENDLGSICRSMSCCRTRMVGTLNERGLSIPLRHPMPIKEIDIPGTGFCCCMKLSATRGLSAWPRGAYRA
jgi:hypothetical protein